MNLLSPAALLFLASVYALPNGAVSPLAGEEGEDRFSTRSWISPGGGWLVVIIEELRPVTRPGAPPGTRASEPIGQWVFRMPLGKSGAAPQLLHRREGRDVTQDGNLYETAAVLDDGTVLAIRTPTLTRWDSVGRKASEKRLAEISQGFATLKAHPLEKRAHLVFQPLTNGDEPPEGVHFLLNPATLRLERARHLRGLHDSDIHWTADGKHIFGVVSVPGKPPWIETPDGTRFPNETYRLVRVDLKSGKREPVSEQVWSHGICFGETTLAWNHQEGPPRDGFGQKGIFWTARISPPHEPREVPALKAWDPVLCLRNDRFLLRTDDWKRHRIVDLAAFKEKDLESDSRELSLPEYEGAIFHSSASGLFLLEKEPFVFQLVDEAGNAQETIRLDRSATPGKVSR